MARCLSVAFFCMCMLCAHASAQVIFGSIQGTVTDESGALIPGAQIAIRNLDTGVSQQTRSNTAGIYFIGEVRPGSYSVEAQAAGFARFVRSGITVRIEDRLRVDIAMRVGQVSETVEVKAEAPLVQSESTTIGKVVEETSIKQLPLNGRNAFDLVLLTPGTQQKDGDEQPRLSGGRSRNAEISLDGTSVSDPRRGETSYIPNLDALQEFKVQTNGLSAEFGRLVGGIVTATLKSGTNQYHGNLFEFIRNDQFNARNFFSSTVPKLAYNQFGGMIGGPIIHDRTFFFADYEGLRIRRESLFNLTVPTPQMKQGDFSSLLGRSVGTDALGRGVFQNQIFDPASTRTAPNGKLVRDAFPGNVIPRSRFDPAGANLMNLYIDPNLPGSVQNFRTLQPSGSNFNKFDVRVDHRFTDRDLFFTRVSSDRQETSSARPYQWSATGGSKGEIDTWLTGALNWTRTITPTTLNDFRFAAFRGRLHRLISPADNTALGIPNLDRYGLPRITVPGYDSLGDAQVFDPTQEQYQFQDIATFVRGRHIIKAGADVRRFRINDLQLDFNGTYNFANAQTADPSTSGSGNPMASLLLGQVDRYLNDPNRGRFYCRSSYMGLFFQDDFKVSPTFTLNIGLRYDVEQNPNETRWNGSDFNLDLGRVVTMREMGKNRTQTTDKNDFGPRVGFAWRPFSRTVIRSHYGIFYIPLTGRATSAFNRFPQSQLVTDASDGVNPAIVISRTPPLVPSADGKGLGQFSYSSNPQTGYFQQYNFDIQRELSGGILLQATYAGSLGRHLLITSLFNVIPIDVVRARGASSQAMRPYPDFGDVRGYRERQNSSYHSLQLSAEKRYSRGLSFLASYTFSKLIDEAEDNFNADMFPMDPYNTRLDKGLSLAHIPQRFVGSAVYDLPFGKDRKYQGAGPLSYVIGGWQFAGILTLQSGQQVMIKQSNNTSRTFGTILRPNLIADPILSTGDRTLNSWFNTAAFQAPPPLYFGNSSKTPGIEGPGLANVDFSLHRNFTLPLNEASRLELRAECYNCLNRANFGVPSGLVGTPAFGRVTSAGAARALQLALKFWF